LVSEHHLAIPRMVDVERFEETRRAIDDGFVEAFSTDEPRRMTGAARAAMQARRKSR